MFRQIFGIILSCCALTLIAESEGLVRVNSKGEIGIFEPKSVKATASVKLYGLKSHHAEDNTVIGDISYKKQTSEATIIVENVTSTEADISWEAPELNDLSAKDSQVALYISTDNIMGRTCLFHTANGKKLSAKLPEAKEMLRKWIFLWGAPMKDFDMPFDNGILHVTGIPGGAGIFVWDRSGAIRLFAANGKLAGKIHLVYRPGNPAAGTSAVN